MVRRINEDLDVASTKAGGHGLGLQHARSFIKVAGGTLKVEVGASRGTIITISLPPCTMPAWLADELVIPQSAQVHILDDDDSIHQVWRVRANENLWGTRGITLRHHNAAESLQRDLAGRDVRPFLCLIDYDLKSDLNGVQVIRDLALQNFSYLVTSRYDDPSVQQECGRLGIKIIPKLLAPRVSVRVASADEMKAAAKNSPFVVVLRRDAGQEMQYCPAASLDDARLHAERLIKRDSSVHEVTVMEKSTNTALGSVKAADFTWQPASSVPLSRMTWH